MAISTYEDLLSEISAMDKSFRNTARSICKSKSHGDDLYHSSILKILELSLLGLEIQDLKRLLYSTMVTTRLDMLRNFNSKTQSLQSDTIGDLISVEDTYVENRDLLKVSFGFIDRLKDDDKKIFLSYINGIKIKTISKIYNLSVNSVKSKLRRIRMALKSYLNNDN